MTPWTSPPSAASAPSAPSRLRAVGRMALVSLACLVTGLALFGIVFAFSWADVGDPFPVAYNAVLLLDLVLGSLVAVAIGPMRRAGMWNLVLVPTFFWSAVAGPAILVALARIGERRDLRWDALALALTALGGIGSGLLYSAATGSTESPWIDMTISVATAAAALLWGRVRGTRAALVASLRTQVATAQRERKAGERARDALARRHEALIAQAEAEQRSEIARDMHDSLSHHLSLIAMHAGALAYREDMEPQRMREVAGTIRDSAQEANSELREVLAALRSDGAPLPTGAGFERVTAAARAAGHEVHLEWTDALAPADLDEASPASVVALERITRELVTNARKHAPGMPLQLRFGRSDEGDGITLVASNPVADEAPAAGFTTAGLGTGTGLIGVRERVRLLGGRLTVHDPGAAVPDTDPGAEFTVEVFLPWRS